MKKSEHKGQVALILVLIMVVVAALAVSLASRSTIDTRIQQTESESVQALLFAQTGLEQLILNPGDTSTSPDPNFYAVKSDIGMQGLDTGSLAPGSTLELNLVGADFNTLTGLVIYWKPDLNNAGGTPALKISSINSSGVVTNYLYDYTASKNFLAGLDGSSEGFDKRTDTIPLSGSVSKIRITVMRTPALVKIVPVGTNALFPSQFKSIKSTGTVSSNEQSVKYGLQYDESTADSVPSVFDYSLFSGGSIVQ